MGFALKFNKPSPKEAVRAAFARYGTIVGDVNIKPYGGFVNFATAQEAWAAYDALQTTFMISRPNYDRRDAPLAERKDEGKDLVQPSSKTETSSLGRLKINQVRSDDDAKALEQVFKLFKGYQKLVFKQTYVLVLFTTESNALEAYRLAKEIIAFPISDPQAYGSSNQPKFSPDRAEGEPEPGASDVDQGHLLHGHRAPARQIEGSPAAVSRKSAQKSAAGEGVASKHPSSPQKASSRPPYSSPYKNASQAAKAKKESKEPVSSQNTDRVQLASRAHGEFWQEHHKSVHCSMYPSLTLAYDVKTLSIKVIGDDLDEKAEAVKAISRSIKQLEHRSIQWDAALERKDMAEVQKSKKVAIVFDKESKSLEFVADSSQIISDALELLEGRSSGSSASNEVLVEFDRQVHEQYVKQVTAAIQAQFQGVLIKERSGKKEFGKLVISGPSRAVEEAKQTFMAKIQSPDRRVHNVVRFSKTDQDCDRFASNSPVQVLEAFATVMNRVFSIGDEGVTEAGLLHFPDIVGCFLYSHRKDHLERFAKSHKIGLTWSLSSLPSKVIDYKKEKGETSRDPVKKPAYKHDQLHIDGPQQRAKAIIKEMFDLATSLVYGRFTLPVSDESLAFSVYKLACKCQSTIEQDSSCIVRVSQESNSVQVILCAADEASFNEAKEAMLSNTQVCQKNLELSVNVFRDVKNQYLAHSRAKLIGFQKKHKVGVYFDSGSNSVQIKGAQSAVEDAYDELSNEMQGKIRTKESIKVEGDLLQILRRHKSVLDLLKGVVDESKVSVAYRNSSFVVHGPRDAVNACSASLTQWLTAKSQTLVSHRMQVQSGTWLETSAHRVEKDHQVALQWGSRLSSGAPSPTLKAKAVLSNGKTTVEVLHGDIFETQCTALVNPANCDLRNAGGLARAVASKAGSEFDDYCLRYVEKRGKLVSGDAIRAPSFLLENKGFESIINAVGPIWKDEGEVMASYKLRRVIRKVLSIANTESLDSVALPLISTGIYGFPYDNACQIIWQEICAAKTLGNVRRIAIIDVDQEKAEYMAALLGDPSPSSKSPARLVPSKPTTQKIVMNYQWSWSNDFGGMTNYDQDQNSQIEAAFLGGQPSVDVTGDLNRIKNGNHYEVTFASGAVTKHIQRNTKTQYAREVRRHQLDQPMVIEVPVFEPMLPFESKQPALPSKQMASPVDEKTQGSGMTTVRIVALNQAQAKKAADALTEAYKKNVVTEFVEHKNAQKYAEAFQSLVASYDGLKAELKGTKLHLTGLKEQVDQVVKEVYQLLLTGHDEKAASYPDDWDMSSSKSEVECKLVSLASGSQEWSDIVARMRLTLPNAQVSSIQKVQNPSCWIAYNTSLRRIQAKGTKPNELMLFHGTQRTDPSQIYQNENGFHLGYASNGLWGRGIYFATNASYSNSYAHPAGGSKIFFLCQVLTGDSIEMSQGNYVMPPVKDKANPLLANERHESINGIHSSSRNYIVYENGRAYPKYLITYSGC